MVGVPLEEEQVVSSGAPTQGQRTEKGAKKEPSPGWVGKSQERLCADEI